MVGLVIGGANSVRDEVKVLGDPRIPENYHADLYLVLKYKNLHILCMIRGTWGVLVRSRGDRGWGLGRC